MTEMTEEMVGWHHPRPWVSCSPKAGAGQMSLGPSQGPTHMGFDPRMVLQTREIWSKQLEQSSQVVPPAAGPLINIPWYVLNRRGWRSRVKIGMFQPPSKA